MNKPLPRAYAQSRGIHLLQAIAEEFGPIFTREQVEPIAVQQGLSRTHFSKLLSMLNTAGYIENIKRGVYVVRSPAFGNEIHPFAIAAILVQPTAISYWSALAHHGFTTQLPSVVQASTPSKIVTPDMRKGKSVSPRGRAIWKVSGIEVGYIFVDLKRFFGHQKVWVDNWNQVAITDPERTALDLVARSDIFGGMSAAIEILDENLSRLDISQLVSYALHYKMGATIKRLRWALERLSVEKRLLEPLQVYPVNTVYLLEQRNPASKTINRHWQINENL